MRYKVIIGAIVIIFCLIGLGFGINYAVEQKSPVLSNKQIIASTRFQPPVDFGSYSLQEFLTLAD